MTYTYPPESTPLPGYTIKHGIGQGGFGEVYYAVSDGGKEVALKLIQRQVEVELRGVRECLNLSHPSLVKIYDIVEKDGENWVVMEFCGGESLEEAIDRSPSGMPLDEAVAWFRGMCVALNALHSSDIVHRDLKPSHIFLEDGVIKIADYGLAKFISVSRSSAHTEGIGTIHYTSPEMAQGKYGKGVDLYAMGVIFYEMLSGDVPFDGESPAEILMKHLTALPDMRGFPTPYREIIRKLLEKNPKRRYRSVEELQAVLSMPVAQAVGGRRRFPKTPWAVAGVAGRGAGRGARKVGRSIFSNKTVALLFVCLGMSFAALMVAVDSSDNRRRMSYGESTYSIERLSDRQLGNIRVSTNNFGDPRIDLKEVAKFQRVRSSNRKWLADKSRRRLRSTRYYEININPTKAKQKRISERNVVEAIWDQGYSPVLYIEIDHNKLREKGVEIDDVKTDDSRTYSIRQSSQKFMRVLSRHKKPVDFASIRQKKGEHQK